MNSYLPNNSQWKRFGSLRPVTVVTRRERTPAELAKIKHDNDGHAMRAISFAVWRMENLQLCLDVKREIERIGQQMSSWPEPNA